MEESPTAGSGRFPFPFQPYTIQEQFMEALYAALDQGKVGIFESPTGTGKSLSLICGALTWLRDFETKMKQEACQLLLEEEKGAVTETEGRSRAAAEPDWVSDFIQKKAQRDEVSKMKDEELKRRRRDERLQMIRQNVQLKYVMKRKCEDEDEEAHKLLQESLSVNEEEEHNEEEAGLIVADYESDDEATPKSRVEDEDDLEEEHVTKIYYCSRTHSQLAQFVREVQKSPFGSSVRVVSLGSRQNLCINPEVQRLGSIQLMNERCMELQKNKHGKEAVQREQKRPRGVAKATCRFSGYEVTMAMRDKLLTEVQDIEQLVELGHKTHTCYTHATHTHLPAAQLVVLPYQTLLHGVMRRASGIQLQGQVVIIDEAHNLTDTLTAIHSVEVTGVQLCKAHSQLTQYLSRYRTRLKAKNLMYIKQILFVLEGLVNTLGGKVGENPNSRRTEPGTELQTINDFLFRAQIDNINLFKVQRYFEKSSISRKLGSFVEHYDGAAVHLHASSSREKRRPDGLGLFLQSLHAEPRPVPSQDHKGAEEEPHTRSSPMMLVESFLSALTSANKDGRVVIQRHECVARCSVRFLLLNAALHFAELLKDCRSVIIAGGTMQPVAEFRDHLLISAGVQKERITEFSCGHVIPPENILPIVLCVGPSGQELEFTFQTRDTPKMMEEAGRVLCNLCHIVPGGVVCFFPSYEYEERILGHWQSSGVLQRLSVKKKIFQEPKKASRVDQVLSEYSRCVKLSIGTGSGLTGGLLFSVVGGKMSEGINFSDDLGRCVVMVGMPYPNIKSPELQEKISYLNKNMPHVDGRSPGSSLVENLCMKAVNQSIGRAIRHRGDYACVVLLDRRFSRTATLQKLPGWIRPHARTHSSFGTAFASIRRFFLEKKTKQQES
ncbi:LOW QUALITY PROTEIN: ATP-dependent DNA helicase DDX11 [Denticeps clupeoides]|uniref:LOW QUALITY PROTEIN: ATP-dependent DNA helicase DDX11 n=1 Tax=Denticeps clupeoides TaxID=299321 RepID=UPI0010A5260D|nr:LOW QUALITY PROTEIN: ATP-dependent DNA helicase DDX11 [Denticeps clupeoides]